MPDTSINTDWFREFSAGVHMRPAMYLGWRNAKGALGLMKGVLADIINLSVGQSATITWTIENEKTYCIAVKGVFNKEEIIKYLCVQWEQALFHINLLFAVSGRCSMVVAGDDHAHHLTVTKDGFEYSYAGNNKYTDDLVINVELSDTIFTAYPDYLDINSLCMEMAMLNKRSSILLRDKNRPFANQNFHHFPAGIRRIFDGICRDGHTQPLITTFIDENAHDNHYQVGIAFHTQSDTGSIVSYAGNNKTIEGGSLVDGVIFGIMDGYRSYKKQSDPLDIDYLLMGRARSKFLPRLTIVCVVRTHDGEYAYEGATRRKLFMPEVKRDARKLVAERVFSLLDSNPELASEIRF